MLSRGDSSIRVRSAHGQGGVGKGYRDLGAPAAEVGGVSAYVGVYKTLERDVGPEFAPPEELVALVDAGRVGAKAGAGFEEYSDQERDRLLLERDRRYAALARLLAE